MQNKALELMTEILDWILHENKVYGSARKISGVLESLSKEKPAFKKIHVSADGVKIDADGVDELKKEFAHLLDVLRDVYADTMGVENATRAINESVSGKLLEINDEDITTPMWIIESRFSKKNVESMDEYERINLVCLIYREIIQDMVSKGKPTIPPETFRKITKAFLEANPELPEISISPSGMVVNEEPRVHASKEARELLVTKYSYLVTKYLELLETKFGPEEALELIKHYYEDLEVKHKSLSELGITKSLFRGVFWARVPTGVKGLDVLIEGGFPKKSAVLLQGSIGSEKSMLGTQFIAEALSSDNSALIVLNNTSVDEFRNFLSRFNIDATHYEKNKKLCYVDCYSWRTEPLKDFEEKWPVIRIARDLSSMGIGIQKATKWLSQSPVKRAYLELLSPFLKHFDFDSIYEFTQVLKARLKDEGFTSLFILELGMHDTQVVSSIQEIFDGVIDIKVETAGNEIHRSLVVMHMKDTALKPQYYPINVTAEGVLVDSSEA